ncbi:MAG: nitrogenase molybdenum-iron protein alpha chain [Deltaproteobacteria bacterium]|nr:MAG: nitrogenase molybdenum-iron protein alpha chain [Deltaproteobacteria bacterium]
MSDKRIMNAPAIALDDFVEGVVDVYPAKAAKKRRKHIVVRDPAEKQRIEANERTIPGIISQRGCCYAGCKGVVIGPIGDMVHIVHGPVGCSYYSWLSRRNLFRPRADGQNYMQYCFTTDMEEKDIIFGGEKKLKAAIQEAYDIFKPKAISVLATCPVGLIGDDINSVSKEMSEKLGIQIIPFSCEGYKGVSQSAGHHIANNNLFKFVIGQDDIEQKEHTINILGEYNTGGDTWEIERVLNRCGINVLSVFTGDGSYSEMRQSHMADVNLLMCHRSVNYIADMMETKFGIPWIKVNFIGIKSMAKSLKKIARFYDDPKLTERVEKVIEEEVAKAEEGIARYIPRLKGKTVILFVGGSRAHHYQGLFRDLGMVPIVAGYEFAHRDDYEGREVLPDIKVIADNRNIEDLTVERDPERYNPRKDDETLKRLKEEEVIDTYHGMWEDMGRGTMAIDDVSHKELGMLIKKLKPDMVCSGIKDKYVIEKFGVPSKQLHNYDYSGPFAGFRGAVNFAKDLDMLIHNPVWKLTTPPWKKKPVLKADLTVST